MTKEKMKQIIDTSGDILFNVHGHKYAIFTWMDEGIGFYDVETQKKTIFKTAEDVVASFPFRLEEITMDEYS